MSPIFLQIEGLIPHFSGPKSPIIDSANSMPMKWAWLGDDDITTGVSFSPVGEAFRVGRWMGIFLVAPVIWSIALYPLRFALRRYSRNVRGVCPGASSSYVAPTGLSAASFTCWGLEPPVSSSWPWSHPMACLFSEPSSPAGSASDLRRAAMVRSIPRRLPPIQASRRPGSSHRHHPN